LLKHQQDARAGKGMALGLVRTLPGKRGALGLVRTQPLGLVRPQPGKEWHEKKTFCTVKEDGKLRCCTG